LELAGDERIQEYPPGIMNNNETLIPGHGVFKARSSPSSGIDIRNPWAAFNKSTAEGWDSLDSVSDYSTTDGSYTSNQGNTLLSSGGTYSGEFLEIELPYPIKLKTNYFYPQQSTTYGTPRFFKEALVLGSNNGHTWDTLQSISETSYSYTYTSEEYLIVNTNSETYYKYFRVAVNKVIGGTNGNRVNINEWRLFGTPGPTTLDKGSLSLTRSLDVPRISRYDVDTETPRPEKLVLDFDTTVNSSPTDISGQGNHGAFVNGASYSPVDKAFTFDGTTDTIKGEISGISGDYVHSISFWGNFNATNQTVFEMGSRSNNDLIGINYTTGYLQYYFYANDYRYDGATQLYAWNHFVFTYSGGGTSRKVFLNGVELGLTSSNGASVNQSLTLANGNYSIGDIVGSGSGSGDLNGKISNFKIYSVALEPSEVKKLYNLGRTGRSMVISDTAVGIGKVPEAQLDVRGVANFERVGIGVDNPGKTLDVNGRLRTRYSSGYRSGTFNTTGLNMGSFSELGPDMPQIGWEIHLVFSCANNSSTVKIYGGYRTSGGVSSTASGTLYAISEPSTWRWSEGYAHDYLSSSNAILVHDSASGHASYYAVIRIVNSHYTNADEGNGRLHLTSECVGTRNGVGATIWKSVGYLGFAAGDNGRFHTLRVLSSSGNIKGQWTAFPITT